MRQIPYGEGNFETIREKNGIYIDKTMYIEKLEEGFDRNRVVYLRPRRFGKSLFTSMLSCYYSIDMESKFEQLFKGLYIYDHPTQNKNNYYVLNFNFSGMTIIGKNILEEGQREFYNRVKIGIERFINKYKLNIELINAENAADLLANFMKDFEKLNLENRIYVIIDEYDNFTNAILKGDAKDFLELVNKNGYVRAFYEIIKENLELKIIERFFATGVMPVTLDNLTSGFNNATNLSTHPFFAGMIGFTHEEVKQLIAETIPKEEAEKVYAELATNYDGYSFSLDSDVKTFNSTLVLYYLKNYVELNKPPRKLLDANMNTSSDKIIRIANLIRPQENYETLNKVILNNEINGELEDVVFKDKYTVNTFLTMLFYLGYLTVKEENNRTKFTIPNYVTSTIYAEYFAEYLEKKTNYEIETTKIQKAVETLGETGNIMPVVQLVQEFLKYASNRDMENFDEKNLKYVFTMFLQLSKQYVVYGEFPANQGFADILVTKASSSIAQYEAMVELKYISKKNAKSESKEKLIENAKNQLEYYMKDRRLEQRKNLKKYAIVFIGFEDFWVEEL